MFYRFKDKRIKLKSKRMIRMRYLQLFARWKNFALKLNVRSVFKTRQKFSPVLLFHFDIQADRLRGLSQFQACPPSPGAYRAFVKGCVSTVTLIVETMLNRPQFSNLWLPLVFVAQSIPSVLISPRAMQIQPEPHMLRGILRTLNSDNLQLKW